MRRILILVNHDVVIYNFRKEMVYRLLEEGYEVHISSPYGERLEYLIERGCIYHEVTLLDRHGKNVMDELKLIAYYKRLIREVSPEIVLAYTIKPNIYGAIAARSNKVPIIASVTGLGAALENKGITQVIATQLYRFAFTRVARVFFQNSENMAFFQNHRLALGKHTLVPGSGVNLVEYQVLDYPSDETVEFLMIARIMKQKGIDQYLEAASHIRDKYPFTRFHIIGFCEEAYEDKLQQMTADGIIQYHGMQKDVRVFIGKTHCTVHPTYYPEGMSNVLLESAACGRPLITTDRSGCREIIDDSENGFVVKMRDSQDLIEKIERFLSMTHDQRRQMGLNARAKVEREFDRQIVIDRYMEAVNKIVQR